MGNEYVVGSLIPATGGTVRVISTNIDKCEDCIVQIDWQGSKADVVYESNKTVPMLVECNFCPICGHRIK